MGSLTHKISNCTYATGGGRLTVILNISGPVESAHDQNFLKYQDITTTVQWGGVASNEVAFDMLIPIISTFSLLLQVVAMRSTIMNI